jgi:hypothetical protein
VTIDGVEQSGKTISLVDDRHEHAVEVRIHPRLPHTIVLPSIILFWSHVSFLETSRNRMSSPWSFAERLVRGARKEESPHELRAFSFISKCGANRRRGSGKEAMWQPGGLYC